jgi:hypothetical protein
MAEVIDRLDEAAFEGLPGVFDDLRQQVFDTLGHRGEEALDLGADVERQLANPSQIATLLAPVLDAAQCEEIAAQSDISHAISLAHSMIDAMQDVSGFIVQGGPGASASQDTSDSTRKDRALTNIRLKINRWAAEPVFLEQLSQALQAQEAVDPKSLEPKHVAAALMHVLDPNSARELMSERDWRGAVKMAVTNFRGFPRFFRRNDKLNLDAPTEYLDVAKVHPLEDGPEDSLRAIVGKAVFDRVMLEISFRGQLADACVGVLEDRDVEPLRSSSFMQPREDLFDCPWTSQDGIAYFWATQWLKKKDVFEPIEFLRERGVLAPELD